MNEQEMTIIEEPAWTKEEIEEFVVLTRGHLYNYGRSYGPEAIRRELEAQEITPLPSARTITRILQRECLCGWREAESLFDPGIMLSQFVRGLIEFGPDMIVRRKMNP